MDAVAPNKVGDADSSNPCLNPAAYAKEQALHSALDAVELEQRQGVPISRELLLSLLQKEGLSSRRIPFARRLHVYIRDNRYASTAAFQNQFIRLFASCQSLAEGLEDFFCVAKPSSHSWYAVVAAYTKCGEGHNALKAFDRMQQSGVKAGLAMLSMAFKACGMAEELKKGQLLHSQVLEAGVIPDSTLENAVMDMYGKCGLLEDAHKVFLGMAHPDLVSWNALIGSYVKHGHSVLAINLFSQMCARRITPSEITYSCLLKACVKLEDADVGKFIHKWLIVGGFETDLIITNTLIDMYAKCGMLEDAHSIFSCLRKKSLISWGSMISGFAHQGRGFLALLVFSDMIQEGIKPNRVVLSCVLKTCSTSHLRSDGMVINDLIIQIELECIVDIGNALLDMYIACGSILDAENVFSKLPLKDHTSWNTMICGYLKQGCHLLALESFWKMQQAGLNLSKPLALCIIKACATVGEMLKGRFLHMLLVETEQDSDLNLQNALLDMYTKCGSLDDAQHIFDTLQGRNLVSWSALIAGYAAQRQNQHALDILAEMQQEGIVPNDVIYLTILRVCTTRGELKQGRLVHDQIVRDEFDLSPLVNNMIIYMYAYCGSLQEGRKVFDASPAHDVVSWGVMLDGCAQNEDGYLALELFEKMQNEDVQPNKVILTLVLKSCTITGSIEQGRLVHDLVIDAEMEAEAEIVTTLIDMYGSCGSLNEAHKLFNMLPRQDISSWNALIGGYSQHGFGKIALQCFHDMQGEGLLPDAQTFTSVLAACSHEGYAESGRFTFSLMRSNHSLSPTSEHLNCIVDNLSRTGSLYEADELLHSGPQLPNVVGWLTLLTACKTFGSNTLGRTSFHGSVQLDLNPHNNTKTRFVRQASLY